ncbi:MAG: hypothetical protein HJJLKODD_02035 [Phycisphaerae bacterium]|nr:hypothetical protein [Phycisphaerae bacterium]
MLIDANQIGMHTDDLPLPPREAFAMAARLGAQHLQVGVAQGELQPDQLGPSGRRHLQRFAAGLGLRLAALQASLGPQLLLTDRAVDEHLARTRRALEMAAELEVGVVSITLPHLRSNQETDRTVLKHLLHELGQKADQTNRLVGLETGGGSITELQSLLDELRCPNLKICYDPGLRLMAGEDPLHAIETLSSHIILSHLRDGFHGDQRHWGREANLGSGQLNVGAYLQMLQEAGYHGPQILRRSDSGQPTADLQAGLEYLQHHQPPSRDIISI